VVPEAWLPVASPDPSFQGYLPLVATADPWETAGDRLTD
jgi:hypothetical protein